MSILDKYMAGWSFRTKLPDFDPGQEIEVMVTAVEDGAAKARIGDSILRINEVPGNLLHKRVLVKVDEWDRESHYGEATYLETTGESSF